MMEAIYANFSQQANIDLREYVKFYSGSDKLLSYYFPCLVQN